MRNSLASMLLIGACCLVLSQEAKADVSTITEVSYYEPTNSIWAWAETIPDYDTLAYYDVWHWGIVNKNDTQISMFGANSIDGLDAYNEEFFPYDPDADFTIEAYPQLTAKIRHNIGDTYEDYYNYVQWTYGETVYYPYYYGFTGPGPDGQIWGNSISLGSVFSLFTAGGTAGPPHHLKVLSDNFSQTECGRLERHINYQIVDSNNRKTGKVPVKEDFYNGPVYDSCSGYEVTPTRCTSFLPRNPIEDRIRVGIPGSGGQCPNSIDPSCGYLIDVNRWQWCPRGRTPVTLGTFTYDVHWDSIGINGRYTPWPVGGYFYP